ncbi:MAG TPA: thioredoxin family protein [Candidatus Bathyarchaeia archaeon]|nr:thioredoxin family protein [Candidatus Bathyarchaeia archaeon]
MVTKERFEQGLTASQYVDQMTMNRERLLATLQSATLSARDTGLLQRLVGTRHILAITEDWCGAAIASLPYVMKLAESAPHVTLRIFLRDENPDLMDQFLKDGRHRSIPVFVFLDENMHELARFIERRPE